MDREERILKRVLSETFLYASLAHMSERNLLYMSLIRLLVARYRMKLTPVKVN